MIKRVSQIPLIQACRFTVTVIIIAMMYMAGCSTVSQQQKDEPTFENPIPIVDRGFCLPSSEFKLGEFKIGMDMRHIYQRLGRPEGERLGKYAWHYPTLSFDFNDDRKVNGIYTFKSELHTPSGAKVGTELHDLNELLDIPMSLLPGMSNRREMYIKNCPNGKWDAVMTFSFDSSDKVKAISIDEFKPCFPKREFALAGLRVGMSKETILRYLGPPLRVEGYSGIPRFNDAEDLEYFQNYSTQAIETLVYDGLKIVILKVMNMVAFVSTTSPKYPSPSNLRVGMDESLFMKLAKVSPKDKANQYYAIDRCQVHEVWDDYMTVGVGSDGKITSITVGIQPFDLLLRALHQNLPHKK